MGLKQLAYFADPERSNGSGIKGVTGLKIREGKSRMLGERISGFLGEKPELGLANTGFKGLILRFLIEFLRS